MPEGAPIPPQKHLRMTARQYVEQRRDEILQLAEVHGACNVRLFGSAARGEDTPDSDLDFLVQMRPGRSLLDLVALWQDMEDLLGRSVDVLSEGGVSPYLKDRILSEAIPL